MKKFIPLFICFTLSLFAQGPILTVFADSEINLSGHAWVKLDIPGEKVICCGMQAKGLCKEPKLQIAETTSFFEVEINDEQAEEIKLFLDNPGPYDAYENNCVDLVVHILDLLELEHPSFRKWNLSQPRLFYNWVTELARN